MTYDQSHPIFALSDALVDELCDLYPDSATYLGITGYDDRWSDLSPAGAATTVARLTDMQSRVAALPPATNRWEDIAVAVAHDELDRLIDYYAREAHLRDLNSIASPVQGLREPFDHMNRESAGAWENICSRLERLDEVVTSYIASLEQGRRRGMTVATRQVEEAARQAEVTASERSSFTSLPDEYDEAGIGDDTLRARLVAGVAAGKAAFATLAAYLREEYAADAGEIDAVGEERYRWEAARMLGTEIDPHETYRWGWSEVAALRARMEEVAEDIVAGGGVAEALKVLKTDPDRLAATPHDLVSFLEDRLTEALERLAGSHFDVPEPIRRCDVKLAPPGGSLGAYYVGPSEDFTRAGSVWWSIDRSTPTPLYDNVTTAYHEGFPGHHLQIGVQASLRDRLSRMHRLWTWMSGSGEGWALYAERLMEELGYLDTPDYVFGYLAAQMLRACRVVIDIGSHLELELPDDQPFHPGETWTYDIAVEMLENYATLDLANARSEVNRYLGWPGQAIAYKVGEREILKMRDEVREKMGPAFEAKAFHSRLLEVGPLGLDVVRKFVLDG